MTKEMSVEQKEQEEGPGSHGAFLSLSAQASSPLRGTPAAENSSRVSVKEEEADLGTCLSLQQPSQRQTLERLHEQQAHVHVQESQSNHDAKQSEASFIRDHLYDKKTVDITEQARPSLLDELPEHQEHSGATDTEKSSSLEYEKLSSQGEQQRPGTNWLALSEHQRAPSRLGFLQQQSRSSSPGHSEDVKETTSFGFSAQQNLSSLHKVSEQLNPGVSSLSASPLSVQAPSKEEKHIGLAFEEKLMPSQKSEKMPPLHLSSEDNLFLHRQEVLSPQAEQAKSGPVFAQEQKALFPSKGVMDQRNYPPLHNYSDPQTISMSAQWHQSTFTQAHVLQGLVDPPKDISWQGHSAQQKATTEIKAQPQVITQSLRPQEGSMLQSAPPLMQNIREAVFSKPNVLAAPSDQDALVKGKELNISKEPSQACLSSSQGSEHIYPAPLATHEAVLADRRLFMQTLGSLHAAFKTQVTLPKVEGIDLDLLKLYKEVTSRGGLEAVMKKGEWQDVVLSFNFPSNALSASHMLRKIYVTTLGHYEQVYFLGAFGRSTPPAVCTSQSLALVEHEDGRGSGHPEVCGPRVMNGSTDSARALGVDPASSVGAVVSGAIDGKFEDGYLVTVTVGARRMRGVLYHVPSTDMPTQSASVSSMMQSVSPDMQSADMAPKVGRKRKKKEVFRKDPNAPRQNRTGYNFFFAEQRAKLKTMQPDKDRAISKMIGELWSKLSEEDKSPYQVKGIKDKERYVKEMKEYKERMKLPLIGGSNEAQISAPIRSQLSYGYISQAVNDVKASPQCFTIPYLQQASNNLRGGLPQHTSAMVSKAVEDSKAVQPQPLLTFTSGASSNSQITPLFTGRSMILRTAEQPLEDTPASIFITAASHPTGTMALNTTSSTVMLHAPTVSSDPLVAPTTMDMSKFLVDSTSLKSLPQSDSPAVPGSPTNTPEYGAAMEQ